MHSFNRNAMTQAVNDKKTLKHKKVVAAHLGDK